MQEEAGTPMGSVSGYLVVTTLALYVNSSHRLDKDEHFSS